MMFWYGWHRTFWQAGPRWAGMIVSWGLLIWAAYALITNLTSKPGARDSSHDARIVPGLRLARDEISPDEYQRRRDRLSPGDHLSLARSGSVR